MQSMKKNWDGQKQRQEQQKARTHYQKQLR